MFQPNLPVSIWTRYCIRQRAVILLANHPNIPSVISHERKWNLILGIVSTWDEAVDRQFRGFSYDFLQSNFTN